MKKHLWAVLYSTALLAFTVYIALDTFVLASSYKPATEMNTALFSSLPKSSASSAVSSDTPISSSTSSVAVSTAPESSAPPQSSEPAQSSSAASAVFSEAPPVISEPEPEPEPEFIYTEIEKNEHEGDYHDDNIDIKMMKYRMCDTTIYAAEVRLSSAQYLKTALANDTYGKNVVAKTSKIAEDHNAVLAINGDYYGVRETGYVIRNGIVYRDSASNSDVLCIYPDGRFEIYEPYTVTAQTLADNGAWQAFSFGPQLVGDGKVTVSENEEVTFAKANNQRTAIGIIDDLHYLMVVTDGRSDESRGLTLYQMAHLMKSLGAKTAYNLDGGGSSTMVYQGVLLNKPTASGDVFVERKVSDIVYIG